LQRLRTLHLFAGAGGGILADLLLGHQPVCAVENNQYCQQVLSERQKDGCLPWFPIFGDVCTFDGRPWRGRVDVISGGFPCQDISAAGTGKGLAGARSGLWREFARIVGEVRPRFALIENSPLLRTRGLGVVLEDMDGMGRHTERGVLSAADVGAPHLRKRMWIVAHADSPREPQPEGLEPIERGRSVDGGQELAHTDEFDWRTRVGPMQEPPARPEARDGGRAMRSRWFASDPADEAPGSKSFVGRVADGVANRMDRLKCLGNGQVPAVEVLAFSELCRRGGWA